MEGLGVYLMGFVVGLLAASAILAILGNHTFDTKEECEKSLARDQVCEQRWGAE